MSPPLSLVVYEIWARAGYMSGTADCHYPLYYSVCACSYILDNLQFIRKPGLSPETVIYLILFKLTENVYHSKPVLTNSRRWVTYSRFWENLKCSEKVRICALIPAPPSLYPKVPNYPHISWSLTICKATIARHVEALLVLCSKYQL